MTIKDKIHAIDCQIRELTDARRELDLRRCEQFSQEHRFNIGRCFKTPNASMYAIITGVPNKEMNVGTLFYGFDTTEFPAIIIGSEYFKGDALSVYESTIHSDDGVHFGDDYIEIEFSEFLDAFNERVDTMRSLISVSQKQEAKP